MSRLFILSGKSPGEDKVNHYAVAAADKSAALTAWGLEVGAASDTKPPKVIGSVSQTELKAVLDSGTGVAWLCADGDA